MLSNKAYRFRIYPTKEQEIQIEKTFGCCRFVYNYYLGKRIELYTESKKSLSYYDCNNDCVRNLKNENIWLKEVDKFALNNSLMNLEDAFKNFFQHRSRFPQYKSKHNLVQSYKTNYTNNNIEILDKYIKIPKLKLVRCKIHRKVVGNIKSATISRNKSGKYYISILTNYEPIDLILYKEYKAIGIDLGLTDFIVDNTGKKYKNHKFIKKNEKKLARFQRALSRKSSGSKNRDKAKLKVARISEKIANQQEDFCHKLSNKLTKENTIICIESLDVKEMLKNKKHSKSIHYVTLNKFINFLEYKSTRNSCKILKVDKWYPSSQLCSNCNYQNKKIKDLKIRLWTCPKCKVEHRRDENAAKNILREGLRLYQEQFK